MVIRFHKPDEPNGYLSNWYLSDFEIENAISLYFIPLIPTLSAAIRLSLIAITARPLLEFMKLRTMNSVMHNRIMPIVKVESLGVPVIPCAPLIITFPSSAMFNDMESLNEK